MIKIKPFSPKIGAAIYGIDLKNEITEHLGSKIRSLLNEYEILLFKNQTAMSPGEFFNLTKMIYRPMKHPFVSEEADLISKGNPVIRGLSPLQPYKDFPEITGIYHTKETTGNLNEWHSDLNWLKDPSYGSILRCIKIPPSGGDTVFSSLTAACKDLDNAMKKRLKGLYAVHDFFKIYKDIFSKDFQSLKKAKKLFPPQSFPVLLEHPITNKTTLFVNRVSTSHILGLSEQESKSLLEELYQIPKKPEYQCRIRWQENDIALWDNIALQHYAVSDYWPHERKMERISLSGISVN